MQSNNTTTGPQQHVGSTAELGTEPKPVAFRTRYRSETGMIGHYPWAYAEPLRRPRGRHDYETEDLYTAEQLHAAVAAERDRLCAAIKAADDEASKGDYMLDSDDCISVIRGTWNPQWAPNNTDPQP